MEEYKKSYKGFIVMLLLFAAVLFAIILIPTEDEKLVALLIFNIAVVWMTLLTWVIYKTEKIYWYTGLEYEDAVKASSEQRKKFAMQHFKRFAIFTVIYIVYSAISYIINLGIGFDIAIGTVGIIAVAISTMNIKL